MDTPRELYHEEIKRLKEFRSQIGSHSIYKEQLEEFSDDYEELVAQAKVITRVSDRLQKKLDSANLQIREQNEEIKEKNQELTKTIYQLAEAKMGRRASTIMLTVAIALFILEQVVVQPWIEDNFKNSYYLEYVLFIGIFFLVKFLESGLENFFMKKEKKKIIKDQVPENDMKFAKAQP